MCLALRALCSEPRLAPRVWFFIIGEAMGIVSTIPNWGKGWPHWYWLSWLLTWPVSCWIGLLLAGRRAEARSA
jgi:hypothetical protein